jgi:hypothetical protein
MLAIFALLWLTDVRAAEWAQIQSNGIPIDTQRYASEAACLAELEHAERTAGVNCKPIVATPQKRPAIWAPFVADMTPLDGERFSTKEACMHRFAPEVAICKPWHTLCSTAEENYDIEHRKLLGLPPEDCVRPLEGYPTAASGWLAAVQAQREGHLKHYKLDGSKNLVDRRRF